ncbi:zinc protease [Alkalimonas amylolytica]|uniref:Zinc protease n=1 Tax=Alkalimonas amylolytica TaxID=152573 RepID=A0A1H4AUZ3_ALKAM|nr:pitrilysin family protein [Alkalimonas amylolytica]SEA39661.1 zinc protease [Alkalimonas amylolytica]
MQLSKLTLAALCAIGVAACAHQYSSSLPGGIPLIEQHQPADDVVAIPYQKFELANGLTVIIHEDHSDPLVHVDVTYHVGSAREELGKSGFAHFFEHMMFQGSENVADEEHFKIVTEAGGTLNGTTNADRTNYFQTVPVNQLEKMLWLEADRMGFFLDAVTQEQFDVQQATVKNERGQMVDNRPYGRLWERVSQAMYDFGHPYSWPVIGHMDDIDRTTMADLKQFFLRWYGPNNAVLTIGGAVDTEQVLPLVEKYFGPIPRGPEVTAMEKSPARLSENRYISMEDNVHLPLLFISIPTVYAGHPDAPALNVLADILGSGNNSLLYQSLVRPSLAVQASAGHSCMELACTFTMMALAHPAAGKSLADIEAIIRQNLADIQQRGVLDNDLNRAKAAIEARSIFGLQSVSGKVSQLAYNQTFFKQPDRIADILASYQAITEDDVLRVYRQYVLEQPGVIMSVVPRGQLHLIAAEDNFTPRTFDPELDVSESQLADLPMRRAVDNFDRSVMPVAGANPAIRVPETWSMQLANGIDVLATENDETPTTALLLKIPAGNFYNSPEQAGLAAMLAAMLRESTQNFSAEAISMALDLLGSTVRASANDQDINLFISSLTSNLVATLELVEEILLRPAFKEEDFKRLQQQALQGLEHSLKDGSFLANNAYRQLMYGDSIAALPGIGTLESIAAMTVEDIQAYYQQQFKPAGGKLIAVSDLSEPELSPVLIGLLADWQGKGAALEFMVEHPEVKTATVYLVHKDNSPHSDIRIGRPALPRDLTGEFYEATLMNFVLGGAFNSRINLNLREDKGYTYGARSWFSGDQFSGLFTASASVRADVTAASIREFMHEIDHYRSSGITAEELQFMRNAINQSEALRYETPSAKLGFMAQMLEFSSGPEFTEQRNQLVESISQERINQLAKQYLDTAEMVIVVVGERDKVLPQLEELGYPIIEL